MQKYFAFFLFSFCSILSFAQIGLPIQTALLPKNNLVLNYDFSKSISFIRDATTVTNIAGTASGNASIANSPIFINSMGFISLNGTNQYVVTPNIKTYFKPVNGTIQKSFTMSFWIYPTAASGVLISELDSQTPNSGFHATNIEIVNGSVKYRVWNSAIITSLTTVNQNEWSHISMVYDGNSLKGFLNGILQGTEVAVRDIPSTSQNYAIGAADATYMGTNTYGKFNLAQFKIHNLPLSDMEVLQEYELRKNEFDYTIHSPETNINPIYWNVSGTFNNDAFNTGTYTPWLNSNLGWAPLTLDANQFITLNYDEPVFIKGIVIQPRAASFGQFVTKVHVETSLSGAAPWTRVESDIPIGTSITNDARILFPTSVFAKSVRVIPVSWSGYITMRMGMLVKKNTLTGNNLVLHFNPAMVESYSGTGTNLVDLAGNGFNGTMSNLSYSNPGLNFNGTNSQVSITDHAGLEPGTGSWTIEVWFKNAGTSGTVVGKYNNGGRSADISYALRLGGANVIRADFSNGTTAQSTDNYTFSANNWVQMVYVWDKTNSNIYTYSNGDLKHTKAITISGAILNASRNLYLGSYNGGEYAQYFSGKMGIVRIYKKALNASEVLKNFNTNKDLYGL